MFWIGREETADEFAMFPAEEKKLPGYDFLTDTGVMPDFGGEI